MAAAYLTAACFAGTGWDIYWENDSRFAKPNGSTDRHYTNGLKFVYTTDNIPKWGWTDYFGGWCFGDIPAEEIAESLGLFLGQNIYTPSYVDEPARRPDEDMRFAGWLYGGLFLQRTGQTRLEHTEINLGVVGPSAKGRLIQNYMHELVGSDEPVGWEDQIDDEFAFDFSYYIKDKLDLPVLRPGKNFDVLMDYGLSAGSVHRHAELGLSVRYGFNLDDFGPGRLGLPVRRLDIDPSKQTCYIYLRTAGRAVEYNRFLKGLDKKPLVGSLQAGFIYRFKSFTFGYSQTFLTREFDEQNGQDSFGAITLSWVF